MDKNKESQKKKSPISLSYLFYDFVKFTAIPAYLWKLPKRIFESKKAKKWIKGGALLISNHYSFSDPVLMMLVIWYRRHHFICIKSLFDGKKGFFFRRFKCIPIDKENFGMQSFRTITEHLKNDELVSMFPEGHVNRGDGVDAFKSGVVLMSVMSGKPIVPMYMKPRKHFYNRSVVVIGEPIDITAMYGERPSMKEIEEAARMLHAKEEELQQLAYQNKKERE